MRRIQQGWHIGWLQVTSRSFYSIHERDRKYLSTLGPEETAQTSVLLQFRRSVFDLVPDIAEEPRFGEVSFSRPRAEIYMLRALWKLRSVCKLPGQFVNRPEEPAILQNARSVCRTPRLAWSVYKLPGQFVEYPSSFQLCCLRFWNYVSHIALWLPALFRPIELGLVPHEQASELLRKI